MDARNGTRGNKIDLLKAGVVSNAAYLNRFLSWSCGALAFIIAVKIQQQSTTFEIANLKIATVHAWIVMVPLTIAHQVIAGYFLRAIDEFEAVASDDQRRQLFEEVTIAGPPFFRGLRPRLPANPSSRIFRPEARDPTAWLYLAATLLIPLASVPFNLQDLLGVHIAIALYLMAWNWLVGGRWAIRLGQLAIENVQGARTADGQRERNQYGSGASGSGMTDLAEQIFSGILLSMTTVAMVTIGLVLVGIYLYS